MGIKLSKILSTLHKIQSLNCNESAKSLLSYIDEINASVEDLQLINKHELNLLETNLKKSIEEYQGSIQKLQNKLDNLITENYSTYLKASEENWKQNNEKMLFHEHLEWISLWPPNESEREKFFNEAQLHVNWQYPGLVFGSKSFNIIDAVKGTEPFYVVEQFTEYFDLHKDRYHPDFTRKIRFYKIEELNMLPDKSIGLIVIYNEFPFLPWDKIIKLIYKLLSKLMDGGTLVFNYNECNTVRGFVEFENKNMSYTTYEMFDKFLSKYDMNCIKKYVSDVETFSFLTYRKSGSKTLNKMHPSFGFIDQQPSFTTDQHQKRIELIRRLVKNKNNKI